MDQTLAGVLSQKKMNQEMWIDRMQQRSLTINKEKNLKLFFLRWFWFGIGIVNTI